MDVATKLVTTLLPVKFEDNSRNPGSLDSMLWNLTDRKEQFENRDLREAIRVEIRHITEELAYHDVDRLDQTKKGELVNFLIQHILQNFAGFDFQKVGQDLTPIQKKTLILLFPPLITALIEARELYKANPDAEIKVQLVGHENDNYQLFVEKRMVDGKWVFDLTNETAGVNQQKRKSVQYGKLMCLEELNSEEKNPSHGIFERNQNDITFII